MAQQLKKLLYNKKFIDSPSGDGSHIAKWGLSLTKVFFFLIAIAILLTIFYAYIFTSDPREFLGTLVFYAITIIVVFAVLVLIIGKSGDLRKLLTGFLIALILILVFYWVMGLLLGYFNILKFEMSGYSVYIVMSALAYIGAKKIDGELDRQDIFFGLLVFLVMIGGNLPLNSTGGFFANLDTLIETMLNFKLP